MANRAYLFTSDRTDAGVWDFRQRGDAYYDSRWSIPVAWFFFFRASDVRLVAAGLDFSDPWQEVKFLTKKKPAIDLFAVRQPLLLSIIGSELKEYTITKFLETVSRRQGKYLLLNPEQVLGSMPQSDEQHYEALRRILIMIDDGIPNLPGFVEAMSAYTNVKYSNAAEYYRNIVGYMYE